MHSAVDFILNNYIETFISLDNLPFNLIVSIFLLMIPISIVHEAIHGAVYMILGGRVIFGFKFIYAYTREVSGIPLLRTQFLIVLLAPIMAISFLSLLLPQWLGEMVFFYSTFLAPQEIFIWLYAYLKSVLIVE